MANLQHIAEKVVKLVRSGKGSDGLLVALGYLIDEVDIDPDMKEWVNDSSGFDIERAIGEAACVNQEYLSTFFMRVSETRNVGGLSVYLDESGPR
ncbi:hypothetical protein [Acidithiobacillus ferridurans]|uniref:Uncharacterized protein n=1 Tax=Acidithiobacillus ferridurans TaxID=1232575 RepID=A0A8X8G528_ACIFI|nr:hypothetical protein [Acidithiobacillus ferridurans]MBU2715819.1 hypothetical protein [Acidithiobacillus ferridurans]MBU2722816.1 hypothetical protein [Acidithiobacillus ferridurans]MBU2727797.1 hypothetical protein [Acidithiobacillus ferridurans]